MAQGKEKLQKNENYRKRQCHISFCLSFELKQPFNPKVTEVNCQVKANRTSWATEWNFLGLSIPQQTTFLNTIIKKNILSKWKDYGKHNFLRMQFQNSCESRPDPVTYSINRWTSLGMSYDSVVHEKDFPRFLLV